MEIAWYFAYANIILAINLPLILHKDLLSPLHFPRPQSVGRNYIPQNTQLEKAYAKLSVKVLNKIPKYHVGNIEPVPCIAIWIEPDTW